MSRCNEKILLERIIAEIAGSEEMLKERKKFLQDKLRSLKEDEEVLDRCKEQIRKSPGAQHEP